MRSSVPVAVLVALSMIFATVQANHSQTEDGKTVAFDHKTGNEWWVELSLSGADTTSLAHVEAQDADDAWVELEKKDWGSWGASFHIEPGNDVRFRASWTDGSQVVSCWFTHPAGEEKCEQPWHRTEIGHSGASNHAFELDLGDTNADGHDELFVATQDGIQVQDRTEDGWQLVDTIAPERPASKLVVGDADDDGRDEVYAESPFNELHRYVRNGTTWDHSHIQLFSISTLALGDPDDDGQNEVYVGGHGDDAAIVQVRIVDGDLVQTKIAEISYGTRHLGLGDGDGDGDVELYSGGGNRGNDHVRSIDFQDGSWTNTFVDGRYGTSGTAGVAAGEATGKDNPAVFTARIGFDFGEGNAVWMSTFNDTWDSQVIATFEDNPRHLVMGDADNEGTPELYVSTFSDGDGAHNLHQVRFTDGAWRTQKIATLPGEGRFVLALGDADDDDLQDVYALEVEYNGHIYQVTDHPPQATVDLTFDHRGGNEWWVQVRTTGDDPSRVQARDTGDGWKELELRDWGDWAASFHVEPGHDVRFRSLVDGAWYESCWFTHPDGMTPTGAETCGIQDADAQFDASFSTPGGNEWWVEVYVGADEPLAGVDARVDGGSWIALEKKDWGAWAKSFHVEDGSLVEFRATSTDGDTDLSSEYRWPGGEKVS